MEIIERNEKPKIKFKCDICKTVFVDDGWKMEEVLNPYGNYVVHTGFTFEEPTQRCPTCKNKVNSSVKYVKIEN